MTRREAGPYPLRAIRTFPAIACLALCACATTDVVSRAEHAEVLAVVRALRADNARLEARLEKLEAGRVTSAPPASRPQAPAPGPAARATSSADALPPLTVVRLKPRREAPPRLDTQVEIAEPPDTVVSELKNEAPAPDEADLAMADAQFERGLEMLKTGNAEAGVAQLQQFVTDWPRHPRADNALYLAGTAFLAEKDFAHASELFERVLAQYPAGDAVLDSMLKLAECRLRLNRPREARATWEKIVSHFPGTAAASQAQARLVSSTQTPVGSP